VGQNRGAKLGWSAWSASVTLPPKDGRNRWALNKRLDVVARTIEEAIALVTERYPDGAVYAVNHKGGGTDELWIWHPEFRPDNARSEFEVK
jgi:hypothetical protein